MEKELIPVIFKYPDGFSRTFQKIPFWWIPYRARSVPNRYRPVRIYLQGSLELTNDNLAYMSKMFHCVMHPNLREGVWLNGEQIF